MLSQLSYASIAATSAATRILYRNPLYLSRVFCNFFRPFSTFYLLGQKDNNGIYIADGYAAIGDSAFMTVPIIGSGIANSMKASAILADAIMDDKEGCYSAKTLWKYQRGFYSEFGNGLAPLASIKLLLTRLNPDELDYIFEKEI